MTRCCNWIVNYITFQWFTIRIFSKYAKNINILNKKETYRFFFFRHFLVFEKSHILLIDIYCYCIYASYALFFHSTELSNYVICNLKKNKKTCLIAFFARVQLCISSFACKLLCRLFTLIAEVNSCINFIFCITIIMLYLSKKLKEI